MRLSGPGGPGGSSRGARSPIGIVAILASGGVALKGWDTLQTEVATSKRTVGQLAQRDTSNRISMQAVFSSMTTLDSGTADSAGAMSSTNRGLLAELATLTTEVATGITTRAALLDSLARSVAFNQRTEARVQMVNADAARVQERIDLASEFLATVQRNDVRIRAEGRRLEAVVAVLDSSFQGLRAVRHQQNSIAEQLRRELDREREARRCPEFALETEVPADAARNASADLPAYPAHYPAPNSPLALPSVPDLSERILRLVTAISKLRASRLALDSEAALLRQERLLLREQLAALRSEALRIQRELQDKSAERDRLLRFADYADRARARLDSIATSRARQLVSAEARDAVA